MSNENLGEGTPEHRDEIPVPSDDPEVSSDDVPDAEELTITPGEAARMQREAQLGFETFEQGIQG